MMFPHQGALPGAIIVLLLLFVTSHCQSNSRSYDTNDWIPVSRPCPTCFQNPENQADVTLKKPTGRVLNLPATDQKRFFPEEQTDINSQPYRGTAKQFTPAESHQQVQVQNRQQQHSPKYPEVTTYVPSGQQILLPPQLQNIIVQGQPLLSPQRINSQLLQDIPYRPTIRNEDFRGNNSQFNPRHNENLNLYNQPLIKSNPPLQQPQKIKQNINNGPEEIQLVYVPLENLRPMTPKSPGHQITFPTDQSYSSAQSYNQQNPQPYQPSLPHKQAQLHNIEQDFVQQALQAQKLQEQFQQNIQGIPQHNYRTPYLPDVTTVSPPVVHKKRKPHQPPLAVYMGTEGHPDVKITDVLSLLKDAKTISVQDSVGPDSPQVFVGPSHLEPPEGYVKFDLPYLSSIEGNRVERKVDQLPFFVAPLSYKAPTGYSKIPFPAPHVGSVVVNHMKELENQARTENHNLSDYNIRATEQTIPQQHSETSTFRPRTRQRQPARVSYPSSTIPPVPIPTDTSYQSLAKQPVSLQQQKPADESLISSNPYGPTQFVQSTTPNYDPNTNPIPEQLFSTYSRFSTPTPYIKESIQNQPVNDQQLVKQQPTSTAQPIIANTQSGAINNDKYTVLEQFPIPEKQSATKYPQENIPQAGSDRHPLRQQTQEYINSYREEPTQPRILPNNQPPSTKQQFVEQYVPIQLQTGFGQQFNDNQNTLNKQIYLEQYNQQTRQPHNIDNQHAINEQNTQQPIQQQVLQPNVEIPVTNIQSHTRQRGSHQLTSDNYYQDQYEEQRPNGRPLQNDKINQQIIKETSFDYNVPLTPVQVKQPSTKTRGRQHFTSQPYYEDNYGKPTETVLLNPQPQTKATRPEYDVQVSTQQSASRGQEKTQYVPDPYNPDGITQHPEEEQGFILPVQLPAISPQLPGLINSLEDQAIRPLLAPLLIPPSEEPTITDSTPDYYSTHSPTTTTTATTTTTTTTTTPAPIVETTTQSKRLRSRHRGTRPTFSTEYTHTTPSSRRPSSYRGRRPYTGRPRNEYNRPAQYLEEVTPTTSTLLQDTTTEAPVRSNSFSRNRFAIQRDRSYISSTTETPKRTVSNGRQRFRTRGRPTKIDEEYNGYTSSVTTDNTQAFKQPAFESGFQASAPLSQTNAYLPDQQSHTDDSHNKQIIIQRPQQDQPIVYVTNNRQLIQENLPIHINPEEYNIREQSISTIKPAILVHQTTIPASAPENNIVGDVIHGDPALLLNSNASPDQAKYNQNIENNPPVLQYTPSKEVHYNSREIYNFNGDPNLSTHQVAYTPENEHQIKLTPTIETPRTRSRTRTRQRTRGHSTVHTPKYQTPPTTSTTVRTTTETKDENEDEEFYGFFRQPSFEKPVQVELKQSADLRSPVRTVPSVAYLSREQDDQPVYLNTPDTSSENSLNTYLPIEDSDNVHLVSDAEVQQITSTSTASTTTEDITSDIKPVTRRPANSFIRTRRPTSLPKPRTEIPTRAPEKYYTVRPTKRPDSQTPKITRIRGRIRKPTKPTTTPVPVETELPYLNNQHSVKQADLSNNNQEYVAPVRQRQRIYNRGRTHFQFTSNDKQLATEEPESPNYPSSFLQAQGLATPRPATLINIPQTPVDKPELSSQEIVTPKPSFQLTIEPEDVDDEDIDQLPYSSINKPKLTTKDLDEGAESQFSAKVVQTPSNFNFIKTDDKNIANQLEELQKEKTDTENESNESQARQETNQEITTAKQEELIQNEETTTDLPTTTTYEAVTEKPRTRKRGYWRLVKQRPVGDVLESAESQNIGTVYANNLFEDEKSDKKYKIIQRLRTTTESFKEDTTISPDITTVPVDIQNIPVVEIPIAGGEMLAPLYEMFGLDYDRSKINKEKEHQINYQTTTQLPTMLDEYPERVETTTKEFNTTVVTDLPNSTEDETLLYSDQSGPSKTEWQVMDESWKSRIIRTSTTTEVSHETEICYRGRCVKSATSENSSEV